MRFFLQAVREVRGGLVPREAGCGEETTLTYKLDLDERGVLKSASPRDSIRAVTGQEQMNVRRLSAEALARGEDVVSVDVDYKAALVDGRLAIVAGHTEVVSRPAAAASAGAYRAIGEANRLASLSLSLLNPPGERAVLRSFSAPD